jgi:SM-20-related protein
MLDIRALRATPAVKAPFDFVVVPSLIEKDAAAGLRRDFPRITRPGSFPVSELSYGPAFATLLEELRGTEFRAAIADTLGVPLEGYPTLITVRGRCAWHDGAIHTDSEWKIVSVLLYLNETWADDGGRLRLLRSQDLDDVAVEVEPAWGTLLAFRRSERSFHGHRPFDGERRAVQLNWVTTQKMVDREVARHRRSALLKRFLSFAP